MAAGDSGALEATFGVVNIIDLGKDVTRSEAIVDGTGVVIGAYGHGSNQMLGFIALPVGRGVVRNDGVRAYVEGQFFMDTVTGADTYGVVKGLGSCRNGAMPSRPSKARVASSGARRCGSWSCSM